MTIKENDFRKIDLNLLIAFAVLFREQSVSLAADKLHLGQPAVSARSRACAICSTIHCLFAAATGCSRPRAPSPCMAS